MECITQLLWLGWDPVKRFYKISWMIVLTPSESPLSVRNRCVIEVYEGVFVFFVDLFYLNLVKLELSARITSTFIRYKSTDIEQPPHFGDSIQTYTLPHMRKGSYKTNGITM